MINVTIIIYWGANSNDVYITLTQWASLYNKNIKNRGKRCKQLVDNTDNKNVSGAVD